MSITKPTLIALEAKIDGQDKRTWTSSRCLNIGRIPEMEVSIADDSVSRRHSEVSLTDEGWVIKDLGSSNGTFLNETRVGRTGHKLRHDDTIRVGRIIFRVSIREIGVANKVTHLFKMPAPRTMIEPNAHESRLITPNTLIRNQEDSRLAKMIDLLNHSSSVVNFEEQSSELQRLLDDIRSAFEAQATGLFLVNDEKTTFDLHCSSISSETSKRPDATVANRAYQNQESVYIKSTTGSTHSGDTANRSIICAILRSPSSVYGALHLERGSHQEPLSDQDFLLAKAVANSLAVGLERSKFSQNQQDLMIQTVTALAQAIECRDPYTGNHTNRVTTYSLLLAEEMGIPQNQLKQLRLSAALHDIGKIAIDDQILRKPGRLTAEEFKVMKSHVRRGVEILETIPSLKWTLPVVRSHHERWDGTGYPDGLREMQIPRSAQIVAVADAFDAMTSDRPYRKGMPLDAAYKEIEAGSGKQFAPECVAAFLRIRDRIEGMFIQENIIEQQMSKQSDTISARELMLMNQQSSIV